MSYGRDLPPRTKNKVRSSGVEEEAVGEEKENVVQDRAEEILKAFHRILHCLNTIAWVFNSLRISSAASCIRFPFTISNKLRISLHLTLAPEQNPLVV